MHRLSCTTFNIKVLACDARRETHQIKGWNKRTIICSLTTSTLVKAQYHNWFISLQASL